MAQIPRYVSEGSIPPAVSNVKMSGHDAAAPYNEYAQGINNFMDIFRHEMYAWERDVLQKEREKKAAEQKNLKVQEGLYKAQAMSDLSIKTNQMYQDFKQKSDGSLDFAKGVDASFQALADPVIKNAPTQASQIDLTKRLISMRSQLYNRATNDSIQINNQANMNKIENMLSQYEGMAASDPRSAQELKSKSGEVFQAMSDLGIPERHKAQIFDKFAKRIDYNAVRGAIEQDPQEVQARIEAGQLSYLGEGNINSLKNLTKSSIATYTKQAGSAIADVEKRVMNGQPLPEDFQHRVELAKKYGLNNKVEDLNRLLEVDKIVAGGTYAELEGLSSWLKQSVADGAIKADPNKVNKLIGYVEGNAKALKEDGLSYAERKGGLGPNPILTDFSNIPADQLQRRQFLSQQVEEMYGVKTPALKKEEIKILSNQLEKLPTEQKLAIVENVATLGDTTVERVAKELNTKSPGVAQAVSMYSIDPHITSAIMLGKEALAAKTVKPPMDETIIEQADVALGKTLFADEPEFRRRIIDAGVSKYAYEVSRGNDVTLEESIKSAGNILRVTGQAFGPRKAYSTVAPGKDMTTKSFNGFVDSNLRDIANWPKYGNGQPISAGNDRPIVFSRVDPSDFSYEYNSSGKYYVYYGGKRVLNESRQPLTIDLRRLYKDTNE